MAINDLMNKVHLISALTLIWVGFSAVRFEVPPCVKPVRIMLET